MAGPRCVRFEVGPGDVGRRLDQVLAARVPGLSRRQARVLLELGGVFVDRRRVKVASRSMRPGQRVEAWVGGVLAHATKATGAAARARDAARLPSPTIVHEDQDVVVVEKPPGLLAAPTAESDRGNLFDVLRRDGRSDLRLVHRIDRDTSGLVVFTKTPVATRALAAQLRTHVVAREYLAALAGAVAADQWTVDAPIGGRPAVTHFAVARRRGDAVTIVRARLETGRTHQIRIHAAALGHPVLGDRTHGRRAPVDPPRLALHAAVLGFPHPRTGAPVRWESPWPPDLAAWEASLAATGA